MLRFTVLASGSRGNCALLETEGTRILVDAGISGRQIEERLQAVGCSLREVQAVFLTHEHGDHVAGLNVLARRHGIPVHCNRLTLEYLREGLPDYGGWKIFETGETVPCGDLQVETFSIPHDAYDPVGFMFHHSLGSVGFLTDLGYATKLVVERVRRARALVLEANHDIAMLQQDTKRPWSVKQRILSRHGHLSNEAAAEVAAQVAGMNLEDLYLGHLSEDCNSPEKARAVVAQSLLAMDCSRIRLHNTSPTHSTNCLVW
jgi:phosphoribosyl 1,2-cyclic phosphodiesterase